ncbi:MAG: glycoside hydrolase family 32 protein [Clostridiales bacterium]|nr:glycoside hydrolase family 32 protein [Clostridiales bacterium]
MNQNSQTKTDEMRKTAEACVHRHLYHAMPPQGWTNDPNGFVFFNGRFHLFYQHYPFAPQSGLMHWGHWQSDDLVRWEHLPIALTPDKPYDAGGCFSGSSVVHEGRLHVFYTGNGADGTQTQCLAVSGDGLHFLKYKNNPVINGPPDTVIPNQFRDPCVFRRGKRFYMVVGAEGKDHQGQAAVYVSNDLLDWTYLNAISAGDDSLGHMWECPNLFFIGEDAVLLLSPQGIAGRPPFSSSHDSGYFVGRFDADTGTYAHGEFRKLDMGFDFYAPQAAADGTGRAILTAWMSTWETPAPTGACQWAGSMILPREIAVQDDRLLFRPARELERYMKPVFAAETVSCGDLPPLKATAGRLQIFVENKDFVVELFRSADGREYTALSYSADAHTLALDLSRSGEAARGIKSVALAQPPEVLQLDIYFDRSSVEVFVNEGGYVMTARVFPHQGSDGIRLSGKAAFRRIRLWEFGE